MPKSILVAEDHPAVAEAIAEVLRDEGYAVRVAPDGARALALLAEGPADLVLSDVMMPVLDGPALLAELRRRGDPAPVVLMSAVAGPWAVGAAADGFLLKPFGLDELLAVVRAALGGDGGASPGTDPKPGR